MLVKFHSQVGQDRFLLENFFRGRRNGVFVDIGAYDGETFSNSLFFERTMGWTGLCVEPLPSADSKRPDPLKDPLAFSRPMPDKETAKSEPPRIAPPPVLKPLDPPLVPVPAIKDAAADKKTGEKWQLPPTGTWPATGFGQEPITTTPVTTGGGAGAKAAVAVGAVLLAGGLGFLGFSLLRSDPSGAATPEDAAQSLLDALENGEL